MWAVATFSLFLAMAAEVSVSVNFFDFEPPLLFAQLDQRERELTQHRVTTMEPDYVAANAPVRSKVGLERVVHMENGHARVVLVVEGSDEVLRPPVLDQELSIKPKLCSDRKTIGYDNWETLGNAMKEANRKSVERFVQWSRFFAEAEDFNGIFDDDTLYYEQDLILTICPGATLRAKKKIFVNAPNIILECQDCTVTGGTTHLSFGPHAKHVMVRGITFRSARTSSLVFYHNGANAEFEDCHFYDNFAANNRLGSVADVNSTSIINFYRCLIGSSREEGSQMVSSLSVRT
jgi:hypothetical protein